MIIHYQEESEVGWAHILQNRFRLTGAESWVCQSLAVWPKASPLMWNETSDTSQCGCENHWGCMHLVKSPDPGARSKLSHSNHLTFVWVFHIPGFHSQLTLGAISGLVSWTLLFLSLKPWLFFSYSITFCLLTILAPTSHTLTSFTSVMAFVLILWSTPSLLENDHSPSLHTIFIK